MDRLILNVLKWGHDRGLHDTIDMQGQLVKLTEELGEVARGVAKDKSNLIVDGIGDMLVVMINLGAVWHQRFGLGTAEDFLEDCLAEAWNQIAARTGKTVNGIFVKDEPPNEEEN